MLPFAGDQTTFFIGVVEDTADPLRLGRVRVRCYGIHSPDKAEIPTESLPWAIVAQPTTSAANSGIGETPRLLNATQVVGIFLDGDDQQQPLVLGSIPGIPENPANPNFGFGDPDGVYPSQPGVSDLPPQAIGSTAAGLVLERSESNPKQIPQAGGSTIDYPEIPEISEPYPKNQVFRSEAGHVHEIDSSDRPRELWYHPSGSYFELTPDGRLTRIQGDDYYSASGSYFIRADGEISISAETGAKIYVNENMTIQVAQNGLTVQVDSGDIQINVADGNANVSISGNASLDVQGNLTQNVLGNLTTKVTGNYDVQAAGLVSIRGTLIRLN